MYGITTVQELARNSLDAVAQPLRCELLVFLDWMTANLTDAEIKGEIRRSAKAALGGIEIALDTKRARLFVEAVRGALR